MPSRRQGGQSEIVAESSVARKTRKEQPSLDTLNLNEPIRSNNLAGYRGVAIMNKVENGLKYRAAQGHRVIGYYDNAYDAAMAYRRDSLQDRAPRRAGPALHTALHCSCSVSLS